MRNTRLFDNKIGNIIDHDRIRRPRLKPRNRMKKIVGAKKGEFEKGIEVAEGKENPKLRKDAKRLLRKKDRRKKVEDMREGNNGEIKAKISISNRFSKKSKKLDVVKKKENVDSSKSYLLNFEISMKEYLKKQKKQIQKKEKPARKKICPMMEDIEDYLLKSREKWILPEISDPKLLKIIHNGLIKFSYMKRVFDLHQITIILAHHLLTRIATKEENPEEVRKYMIPALLVASKFEEYYPESIQNMIKYMYTKFGQDEPKKKEILEYEGLLMSKIQFDVFKPPILDFVNLFGTRFWTQKKILRQASKVVKELISIPNVYSFSPDVIAIAALKIAYCHEGSKKDFLKKVKDSGIESKDFEKADDLIERFKKKRKR